MLAALRENSTLRKLDLVNNRDINNALMQAIADRLSRNSDARKAARLAAQLVVPLIDLRLPDILIGTIQRCLVPAENVDAF